MAIVHFVMKAKGEYAAEDHADYIARLGRFAKQGGLADLRHGNMPEFAAADPFAFWRAADANERKNGRAYTELQIALPRELGEELGIALAREAARDVLGERFAYTLAVHNPEAADGQDQPHFHLMFSERVVDASTRLLPAERFFKRNGAKKDRAWNDQSKADELRARWCELANGALERAGIAERLDPRSYADQGRAVDELLVEPKTLRRGMPEEIEARLTEIEQIRKDKVVLAGMNIEAPTVEAIEKADRESAAAAKEELAEMVAMARAELRRLEKLLTVVKEKARAAARWTAEKAKKLQDSVALLQKAGIAEPLDIAMSGPGYLAVIVKGKSQSSTVIRDCGPPERLIEAGNFVADVAKEQRHRQGLDKPRAAGKKTKAREQEKSKRGHGR